MDPSGKMSGEIPMLNFETFGVGIHECTSNACKPDLRESDSFYLSREMPVETYSLSG